VENNKSWLVQLATAKPSPALVLGMYIVIVSVTGGLLYLFRELGTVRQEVQLKTQADDAKVKAASDSVLFDIIKQKNTELLSLRNENKDCKKEVGAWVERLITSADASAEKREKEYRERIYKFETADSKRSVISAKRELLLKKAETNINTLEQHKLQSNEN